ncbi:MAG: NAD(P)/FAD-dependent oxidoreductase [Methyloprofundus sp.]|nr:NAD(P)/FAD-dependent oxidoreductase [Methyloprofundus sp.]
MKSHYQLLIIGAGPAGLAAAVTASKQGISCALLDEQPALGGQIYRSIETVPEQRAQILGAEYQRGKGLAAAFRECEADYFPDTKVWSLNSEREVGVLHKDKSRIIRADQIIVASGAMERPVPFPGWTLPGVMQAGAGQILFKSAGVVPSDGVVLAGSGPLLLLLAWQYMQAGVKVKAMLDMTPLANPVLAMPKLPRALLAHHYLTKGLVYQKDLKRAGVSTKMGVSDLRAIGEGELQAVHYRYLGREHKIETGLLMTHFGVIPHIWLTQAAGCQHKWDSSQQCWRPKHDQWGNTSIPGIIVAGDGAGINGAKSAEHAGRLAALQALFALGLLSQTERDQQSVNERKLMQAERHIRPFLEAYFAIPKSVLATADKDTIVCRCEEINAGQIREAVANSHDDSNQVKYLSRCGMGACQGRQCANAVAHIVADASGQAVSANSHFRGRPPVAPLTLQQLASLSEEQEL